MGFKFSIKMLLHRIGSKICPKRNEKNDTNNMCNTRFNTSSLLGPELRDHHKFLLYIVR